MGAIKTMQIGYVNVIVFENIYPHLYFILFLIDPLCLIINTKLGCFEADYKCINTE